MIKECVKEVIFEEGVLSGIITEVAHGLQSASVLTEARTPAPKRQPSSVSTQISETKKQVLSAIGGNSYDHLKQRFKNPELFEGTQPLPGNDGQGAALSGMSPSDSGIDISNIPGLTKWGQIAAGGEK